MEPWKGVDVPTHPLPKNSHWVLVTARVRKNDTGEMREYQSETIIDDGEAHPSTYIWEDGNYSCDCNRRLFFGYAAGEGGMDEIDHPCGEGAFSVQLVNPVTGTVFYDEFEPTQ